MSTNITPFAFGDNMVRVHMDENGEPWFVAKDVARALGYSEGSINQLANLFRHVPEEWTTLNRIKRRSENGVVQEREVLTLSEQGLYFFLGRSDKPGALPFQKWLAGEVLPTLRKTGRFAMPGASSEQPLPQGLSPEIVRYLQEFSGPRIALTERVLSLAESMGVKDGQTVRALFELYARTFSGTGHPRLATVLPPEIEKRIWKDIEALTAVKSGWNICRRVHAFVTLCALVEELRPRRNQPRSLRAELVEYLCANFE